MPARKRRLNVGWVAALLLVGCNEDPPPPPSQPAEEGRMGAVTPAANRTKAGPDRAKEALTKEDETRCPRGLSDCDGDASNGCESLSRTNAQCGDCTTACKDDTRCRAGVCTPRGRIAMAAEHACAQSSDGQLWCWGRNRFGEVGDGSTDFAPRPVHVEEMPNVRAFDVGGARTCAATEEGKLECWGKPLAGVAPGDRYNPLPDVSGVTDVGVGYNHICAVAGGHVHCIGQNQDGQLGQGHAREVKGAVQVALSEVVELEASDRRTCAIDKTGHVTCWGEAPSAPLRVGPGVNAVMDVFVSDGPSCAIDGLGRATCFGETLAYELTKFAPAPYPGPARLSPPDDYLAIAPMGHERSQTCFVRRSGAVACYGQPSWSIREGVPHPLPIKPVDRAIADAIDITGNGRTSCALIRGDRVRCWGENGYGLFANGETADRFLPTKPKGLPKVSSLIAGQRYTCASTAAGDIYCWGFYTTNTASLISRAPKKVGEGLGDLVGPFATYRAGKLSFHGAQSFAAQHLGGKPVEVEVPRPRRLQTTRGNSSGAGGDERYDYVLDRTGALYELAWAVRYPLDETRTKAPPASPTVTKLASFGRVADLGRTADALCALRATDRVCWSGRAPRDAELREVANQVASKRLMTGRMGTFAIDPNGVVIRPDKKDEPLSGFKQPAELAVSSALCVLEQGGKVACLGDNEHGQLGDGSFVDRYDEPAYVRSLVATQLVAGESHHCALLRDGGVRCWGSDRYGAVGSPGRACRRGAVER